jgi:hypothetical protein
MRCHCWGSEKGGFETCVCNLFFYWSKVQSKEKGESGSCPLYLPYHDFREFDSGWRGQNHSKIFNVVYKRRHVREA